jgi:hypothetical protein
MFVVHVVDTTKPAFACGPADSNWHADNQSVACTASDSGSGLATPATFSLSTNVSAGTETENAMTDSQQVCDIANNCVIAGPVGPFKVDKKAPSVSATPDRPADSNSWYNNALTVTFSGTDGGSSGVTCDLPVNYSGPDDASASVSGSCKDAVNNSASASFDFKYDGTAPTAALSVTVGTSGANGWYTSDVTIHTSGSGSVSGVTCTADQFQNGETMGQSFNGFCTSGAGLTTDADPLTVKLDKTAPTSVVLTPSGTMGNNDWYVSDVTITTSGIETISTPLTCTASQSQTTDTNGANFNGTCTNDAGLTSGATPLTIKRDATAPTINGTSDRAANGNGWYNADVTVSFACGDNLSGVASCAAPATLGEGANQSVFGSVTDKAGNSASTTVSGINIDKTAPAITAALDKTAVNGWFNIVTGVPTVSFSCSDALSGLVGACPAPHEFGEGVNQSYNQSISDKAGNTASAGVSGVNVDTVAPSINASVSPARPASGWWNIASGAPTVSYTCSDGTSGIASCTAAYLFPEGENQTHGGTAVDTAGNSASTGVSGIDVDLTAPTLAWVGGPADGGNYYFGSVPAAPTCSAADALSGPNGCAVTGYETTVGSHTMTAAAADKAGNTYSETRSYNVLAWNILGFYQPVDMGKVNTAKNGSTVPLKFEVFAGPTELTNTSIVSTFVQKESCVTLSTDDIETYATGGTSLRYDTTGGQFIFNWQTPKVVGGCYKVTLTTQDGTHISADFKLK